MNLLNQLFAPVLWIIFLAGAPLHAAILPLKKFENLKGRYHQQKLIRELDVEIKSEGHFQVSRLKATSLLRWNVEKPKASEVCIDGQGLTVRDGSSSKKKNIQFSEMGSDSSDQMKSLVRLLSLDPENLEEDFTVLPHTPSAAGDFELTPKKPETVFFQSALIHVNPQGLVDKITIKEKTKGASEPDELRLQFFALQTQKLKILDPCAR